MPNGNREISGGVVGKLSGGCRLGEKSLSGDFLEDADSERKASRETFGLVKDENGEMTPDEAREAVENREAAENREAVERYREAAEIARQ